MSYLIALDGDYEGCVVAEINTTDLLKSGEIVYYTHNFEILSGDNDKQYYVHHNLPAKISNAKKYANGTYDVAIQVNTDANKQNKDCKEFYVKILDYHNDYGDFSNTINPRVYVPTGEEGGDGYFIVVTRDDCLENPELYKNEFSN